MNQHVLLVIAYDIANDARRADVSAVLAGIGARVQYSVFEVTARSADLATLVTRLKSLLDPAEDQVRIWQMPAEHAEHFTTILGQHRLEERSDFIII